MSSLISPQPHLGSHMCASIIGWIEGGRSWDSENKRPTIDYVIKEKSLKCVKSSVTIIGRFESDIVVVVSLRYFSEWNRRHQIAKKKEGKISRQSEQRNSSMVRRSGALLVTDNATTIGFPSSAWVHWFSLVGLADFFITHKLYRRKREEEKSLQLFFVSLLDPRRHHHNHLFSWQQAS